MCQRSSLVYRNITPVSAGTPTFPILAFPHLTPTLDYPRGNQPKSIGDLLLLEYTGQHLRSLETADALLIVVSDTIELFLPLSNLPLKTLECVHRTSVQRYLREERLVANAFECLVYLVTLRIIAKEVAALFVFVLRYLAVIEVRGSVDFP